ncbi:predicted protein [Uncinocarpus reesii 1704]|uniref:Uncharacterized protein n=1 Tax=Uncinocarpus reesii (strain UAMH 1704) TaxID=336963 RepID=C4JJQ9_UNCRE|nr:uncharacterized protein UREG_01866 [Uncinocarpus reesii 1704]EEP77017.1 predicted protein [Uncinocarpus reesii 1704]
MDPKRGVPGLDAPGMGWRLETVASKVEHPNLPTIIGGLRCWWNSGNWPTTSQGLPGRLQSRTPCAHLDLLSDSLSTSASHGAGE